MGSQKGKKEDQKMGIYSPPIPKLRMKIIKAFMIPLLSFNFQLLKMAKIHWKEFLKPTKRFLWWKNSTKSSSPWQWCSWEQVAMPKLKKGTRILDPKDEAQAMCENLVVSLVSRQ